MDKVDQVSMIIASHDSINGNYQKLTEIFLKNAESIDTEEQMKMIQRYIKSDELKGRLIKALDETHQLNDRINRINR